MTRSSENRLTRWLLVALLAAVFVPATWAQDAPEPEKPKEAEEERYQREAMEVLEQYVKALGGERAIRKHKHRTVKGEMIREAMNLRGGFEIKMAAPNNFVMTIDMMGMGELKQGYNGKVAWGINPMMGPMILDEAQAADMKKQADFYSELNYKKNYEKIEYGGRESFEGKDAHKIRLVDERDKESFVFFDVENHLQLGTRTKMESEMGTMPMTTIVSDYKEFDGVKAPTLTTIRVMMDEVKLKIDSISHDKIPESVFELPESIKVLVPAEGEKDEDSGDDEDESEEDDEAGE